MKRTLALMLSILMSMSAFAADPASPQATSKTTTKRKAASTSSVSAEIQQMKEALAAQQRQIEELKQQVSQRDQAIQQTQQQLNQMQSAASAAQAKADEAAAASAKASQSATAVQQDVTDLKANATTAALQAQEDQKRVADLEHPASIHYKGITITPGGFIELATVYRTANENASVNSATQDFNIPLRGTTNSQLSEFRFDARQSRLSLLAEGKIGSTKATGYYEMDFLGAAPTANENQSNSFNLRQRQLFGNVTFANGVSLTGGQQWSLFALTRKGEVNRTEWLPMTVNAQYVVGFDWARQPGFRFVKNFSNNVAFGLAVENPSTVVNVQGISIVGVNAPVGGTATAPVFGFNSSPNAQSPTGLLDPNSVSVPNTSNGGASFVATTGANGSSVNIAPDVVAKLAFDRPNGLHFEVKGLARFFRDRYLGVNNTTEGGAAGVGLIVPIVKSKAEMIAEASFGNGYGRYGSGGGIDVTLKPDRTIRPVRTYHAIAGPELHIGKKLDIYAYGGYEYYQRIYYLTSATASVGYGSPLLNNTGCVIEQTAAAPPSCPNQTRFTFEVTPGFWYRFYNGPAGRVQWGVQYSYSDRALWRGVGGGPSGDLNQVYASFRYYIP